MAGETAQQAVLLASRHEGSLSKEAVFASHFYQTYRVWDTSISLDEMHRGRIQTLRPKPEGRQRRSRF
jgi:hypothetical protein